jgi:hypothetical protein
MVKSSSKGVIRGGRAPEERDRGEGREQRDRQRDVHHAARAGRRADEEQRRDAAGAEELRGHHAIGVTRAPQDAGEAQRHRRQHDPRGDEEECAHWTTFWGSARDTAASSAARLSATGCPTSRQW